MYPPPHRLEMMLQLLVQLTQSPSADHPHLLLVKSLASLVWTFPASPLATLQDAGHARCVPVGPLYAVLVWGRGEYDCWCACVREGRV